MTDGSLTAFRRLVTGNSASGKSRIVSDAPTPHVVQSGPNRGLVNLWATEAGAPDLGIEDGAARPVRLEPPCAGTVFRFFQLAPAAEATASPEEGERAAANAFELMGAPHVRVDTSRHPSMHRSETLDYIMVLRGRVKLLLDEGEAVLEPFDVVIQRGTNHAWINLGSEPALMMGVLIDASDKDATQ